MLCSAGGKKTKLAISSPEMSPPETVVNVGVGEFGEPKLEDAGLLGRPGEGGLGRDALATELRGVLGLAGDDVDEDLSEEAAA